VLFKSPERNGGYSSDDEEAEDDELLSDDLLSEGLLSLFLLLPAGMLALDEERLSVLYQPEPLKMMPEGWMTRCTEFLLHSGQRLIGLSVNFCMRSNFTPQLPHS
jgi:hypothetical protein